MKNRVVRCTQILLFVLSFTLEVDVGAESHVSLLTQKKPLNYPQNCDSNTSDCGYKTYPERKYLLKVPKGTLTLGSDSIVVRKSDARYALVKGMVMFNGEFDFVIETPMGTIKTRTPHSDLIIEKSDGSYIIKVILGEAEIDPLGSNTSIRVLAGYENRLSGVNDRGVATTAFPKPIDVSTFFQTWASLYSGDKNQFEKDLTQFKISHSRAVQAISEVYSETSDREIASYEHAMKLRNERIKKDTEERTKIRKMFERRLKGMD